ncbi:MAG TPA: M1 family aminopeptidase, partial [Vicinamibacterales bacterium]|nr:M1 family aminopeptidase [Vicinamibacterales bacterium]
DQGVTGVVLIGHGEMHFHPSPQTEKGQVKIFCGAETLNARFDTAFLRMNPADFESFVATSQITERPVDPKELRRAEEVFREESPKSFALDLGDLSREPWSLLPAAGDFLAEVHTRRFDSLTYARSSAEAEDITLFDRKHRHNIALYASAQKIASNGRFYNEDDLADYDILDYDIDVSVTPDREWIEGRAQVRLKIKSYGLGALTLHLADSLVVQSIVSEQYGRLFGIRVKNQNAIVINLPAMQPRDKVLSLTIAYAGRLAPQVADRETAGVAADRDQRGAAQEDVPTVQPEPSFLYSSRSYWYPQGQVTDYATATMRVNVPAAFDCVASGAPVAGSPVLLTATDPAAARKLYLFRAAQPIRYLAVLISRFVQVEAVTVAFDQTDANGDMSIAPMAGPINHSLKLMIEANPRQVQHGREIADRAVDIAQYYVSLLGDAPYASFTVALVENDLPGGHSPGYFAMLNQPLPTSPFVWRNDPVAFANFPEFFLAHELAHQWWGQAVGWRNYHEQWLSEGFAQYFAALYAQHSRGDEAFASVLRQMRRWSLDESDNGPIYLGYRLGHIRGESRTFRALAYNKGAAVLHMLRRLVGDEAFFRGLRRFYRMERFQKAGTEGFRRAMEKETGRSLDRFFEQWIYGSGIPKLKFSYRIDGADVLLHLEQVGDLFDVPVTVTLQYADRKPVDIVVPVTERSVDMRVALIGTLRGAEISKDDGTLAEIVKG